MFVFHLALRRHGAQTDSKEACRFFIWGFTLSLMLEFVYFNHLRMLGTKKRGMVEREKQNPGFGHESERRARSMNLAPRLSTCTKVWSVS